MVLLIVALLVCPLVGRAGEDGAVLNNRGAWLYANGELAAAEVCYLTALAAAQADNAPAETLARIHGNLGALYKSRGHFVLAVRHYRAALAHRRQGPPREHALALNNLAEVMREAGDANCVRVFRDALRLLESDTAANDLEHAVLLQNLGVALAEAGRFREAVDLLRQSLGLKRRLFGWGHPQVVVTELNLAGIERSVQASRRNRGNVRETVDVLELVQP